MWPKNFHDFRDTHWLSIPRGFPAPFSPGKKHSFLKFCQKNFICSVTKEVYMVGSYGPRMEAYVYDTPPEEGPSGMAWPNLLAQSL